MDGITENVVVGYEYRDITACRRQVLQIYLLIQPQQLRMCICKSVVTDSNTNAV